MAGEGQGAVSPRSELRLRTRAHSGFGREGEAVVEVLRGDEVVASIYGSREGIHIVSDRLGTETTNRALHTTDPAVFPTPGYVIPLLAQGETCPWCGGQGVIELNGTRPCPICRPG